MEREALRTHHALVTPAVLYFDNKVTLLDLSVVERARDM
jgi:hypothetical protein